MSLSDKPTVDVAVAGNLERLDADCATGSFCSSCAIPPRVVGGLWCDGVEWGVVCAGTTAKVGVIES